MKLSFKYNVKNINSIQKNIISDLVWHTKKVSNMLLYDIREGKEKLELNKNLNIISSEIYRIGIVNIYIHICYKKQY